MGKKYAIVGGKLIDGTGAEPVENSLVRVDENGKIEYAGAHQDTPEGYEVIDAAGKTVRPGLIDTHLHFSGNLTYDDTDWVMQPLLEKQAVAVKQAYDCLTHGLTTVCEIGRFGSQAGLRLPYPRPDHRLRDRPLRHTGPPQQREGRLQGSTRSRYRPGLLPHRRPR